MAQLWACDIRGGLCEATVTFANRCIAGHVGHGGECPDAERAVASGRNAPQSGDGRDAHHLVRLEHVIAQASDEIGAPGVHARSTAGEVLQGLVQ